MPTTGTTNCDAVRRAARRLVARRWRGRAERLRELLYAAEANSSQQAKAEGISMIQRTTGLTAKGSIARSVVAMLALSGASGLAAAADFKFDLANEYQASSLPGQTDADFAGQV